MSRPTLQARSSTNFASKTVCLVTGANQGIGYEIVKELATYPNYHVLLGCRDVSRGEEALLSMGAPLNVNPVPLDITSDDSIEHAARAIEQTFGKLDVLVNNAGILGRGLEHLSPRELWAEVYNVNITSTAIMTDAFIPLLKKSDKPRIIMMSSGLGSCARYMERQTLVDSPAYNTSKAALNRMTVQYARQYPEIRCVACAPGLVGTNLNGMVGKADPASMGAIEACRLIKDVGGKTGTFSAKEGPVPW
ncbi:MAG: hypothetical protein Q9227_009390 [Pyrenula ochraceoflavens]